jgi:hypothetical protein
MKGLASAWMADWLSLSMINQMVLLCHSKGACHLESIEFCLEYRSNSSEFEGGENWLWICGAIGSHARALFPPRTACVAPNPDVMAGILSVTYVGVKVGLPVVGHTVVP